jgi:HAD superfamily hydrolase (TIGR01450 family)
MLGRELLFGYDVLLVDLYGVIWSGTHAFPAALAALESSVAAGKEVVILSNASSSSKEIIGKYDAGNLVSGKHFTNFVTSGDVLRDALANRKLSFFGNKKPKKYFVFGVRNDVIFSDSDLENVENLDDADFVYISIPRFFDGERDRMPGEMREHLYVARSNNPERTWDSTSIEPYIHQLEIFLKKNKPIVIANPDKFAICQVRETPDSTKYVAKPIVKQGFIAETYKKMGGEIFAVGKPFPQIYRYAIEELAKETGESVKNICKKRMAMIGDTLETDILGARNANEEIGCKIDGILVLTGISAGEMKRCEIVEFSDYAMDSFFKQGGIVPTHVMAALALDAEVRTHWPRTAT